MQTITLSNNKIVGNFSSPHPFYFVDNSILPAVSDVLAETLKVTFHEDIDKDGDVQLSFTLSEEVLKEMQRWVNFYKKGNVHVVFCPLPMITALKGINFDLKKSPFRAIRIEDRIKKLVSIDKQCL